MRWAEVVDELASLSRNVSIFHVSATVSFSFFSKSSPANLNMSNSIISLYISVVAFRQHVAVMYHITAPIVL